MPDIFDANADTYSDSIDKSLAKFGGTHDFFMTHKAWLLSEILRREGMNPAETRMIDVGCGTGLLHGHISGQFASIDGVDVSKESIRVAKAAHPANSYIDYDGNRLPYLSGEFGLATAVAVFHHVPPSGWKTMAEEMLRVTRPGGLIIIVEHNPFNPVTRHIVNTCKLDEDAVLLRPKVMRNLFTDAGGENVCTRTVLNVPPTNNALKKIDGILGRLPFGAQYYMTAKKPLQPTQP